MKHRIRRFGSWDEHDVHHRATMNIVDPKRCRLMSVDFKRSLKRLNLAPGRKLVWVRARGRGFVVVKGTFGWMLGSGPFGTYRPEVQRLKWEPMWGLRRGVRPLPAWRWRFTQGRAD